jgi:predicted nucleic acid-binding protein
MLQGHPAATACEQFLRGQSGWLTSPLVLFEAKGILTKVYGVAPGDATRKLAQFTAMPVVLLDLDAAGTTAVLHLADTHGLDLTDAALLHLTQRQGARYLATEDQRLAQACGQFGITPVSPLNGILRHQVASWEAAHVVTKGLPRVLGRVHQWLSRSHPQAAQDFWSQTGGGSHLP